MNRVKIENLSPEFYIQKLALKPHPEGGFFAETYRSQDVTVKNIPFRFTGSRNFSTAIYYLLDYEAISTLHRIKSDEIWHFYGGCGLFIHEIQADGQYFCHKLGADLLKESSFQVIINHGSWFAAENIDKGSFTLAGCTVSPGFDFSDFELADKELLLSQYPRHSEIIKKLT